MRCWGDIACNNFGMPWGMVFVMPIFIILFLYLLFAFRRHGFHWCGQWNRPSIHNFGLAEELQALRKEVEELRKEIKK